MDRQHIVVIGNPVDGFSNYGPFEASAEAALWAEEYVQPDSYGLDWWVAPLHDPEEDESDEG